MNGLARCLFGVLGLMALLVLSGCGDAEERYDAGYGDGYAVGYDTVCEIRAASIEGDFNDADYARGYAAGQADGIMACNSDKYPSRA